LKDKSDGVLQPVAPPKRRASVKQSALYSAAYAAERRAWKRIPISIPFFVSGTKAAGERFSEYASALNISAGGLLLATRRYFEIGIEILLEAPVLPSKKAPLPLVIAPLRAGVLRCQATPQCFLVGLKFDQPLVSETESDSDA
jgi:hypothetical protein